MIVWIKTLKPVPALQEIHSIILVPAKKISVQEMRAFSAVRLNTPMLNKTSSKNLAKKNLPMRNRMILFLFSLLMLPSVSFAAELTNPLYTTDIREVISRIIQAILGVTGAIALLMFVYGGFLWLISGGENEKVKKGKETMKWAVLGLAVIIGAYMIVSTIINALEKGVVA